MDTIGVTAGTPSYGVKVANIASVVVSTVYGNNGTGGSVITQWNKIHLVRTLGVVGFFSLKSEKVVSVECPHPSLSPFPPLTHTVDQWHHPRGAARSWHLGRPV